MKKIDAHCHLRHREYGQELKKRGWEPAPVKPTMEENEIYLGTLLKEMDELDIERQVLTCQTFSSASLGDSEFNRYWIQAGNDYLAEVCRQYPDRFSGFYGVPLRNVRYAVEELQRVTRLPGMAGVVLCSHIGEITLDSAELTPFYEEVDRLGLTIFIHPELPIGIEQTPGYEKWADLYRFIGFLFDTTMAVTRMAYAGILERYKNIHIIASHLCGMLPFVCPSVDILWEKMVKTGVETCPQKPTNYFKKIYVDTGRPLNAATLQCTISVFGEDHILFGTDLPNWRIGEIDAPRRIIDFIEEVGIAEAARQDIFYRNARKLLKL